MGAITINKDPYVLIEDSFPTNNSTSLGSDWENYHQGTGTIGVASGRAGPTGSNDGRRIALHKTRMRSHNHAVQFTITTQANGRRTGVMLRVDEARENWLSLGFAGSTSMALQRGLDSPGWEDYWVTSLATYGSVSVNDVIRVEARFDTVKVFRNGTQLGSTYTGIPYDLGENCRRVGIFAVRGSWVSSGTIDDFSAWDLLDDGSS